MMYVVESWNDETITEMHKFNLKPNYDNINDHSLSEIRPGSRETPNWLFGDFKKKMG